MSGVQVEVKLDPLPVPGVDDEEIAAWIEERLNDARNYFVRAMGPRSGGGRNYGRRGHVASSPGQFPRTDEGRLVNSIDYQMTSPHSGQLFSDIEYAAYLTDGTRYMAPRRMLKDALDEVLAARPQTDQLAKAATWKQQTFYEPHG